MKWCLSRRGNKITLGLFFDSYYLFCRGGHFLTFARMHTYWCSEDGMSWRRNHSSKAIAHSLEYIWKWLFFWKFQSWNEFAERISHDAFLKQCMNGKIILENSALCNFFRAVWVSHFFGLFHSKLFYEPFFFIRNGWWRHSYFTALFETRKSASHKWISFMWKNCNNKNIRIQYWRQTFLPVSLSGIVYRMQSLTSLLISYFPHCFWSFENFQETDFDLIEIQVKT